MSHTSVVQIDLSAINHNMYAIRQIVGTDVRICPIVKANGYGLGAQRVAKRLAASGADMLAVYTIEQAEEIVRVVPGVPVLVLMPTWAIDPAGAVYRAMTRGRIHLSVHGSDHLDAISSIADAFGSTIPLHVELDTGMHRGGVSPDMAPTLLRRIASTRRLRVAGLYTHYASATRDAHQTEAQTQALLSFTRNHASIIPSGCVIHAANTAAMLRDVRTHQMMVRTGLAWCGYGPELIPMCGEHANVPLRPCLSWTSSIVHIKSLEAGERVGYNGVWHAPRATRIALVPVGYADGYPILCGTDHTIHRPAKVTLFEESTGRRFDAPVVGAVNMDQMTIDITDVPASVAHPGATVELYSNDPQAPNHVPTLAAQLGVPPHHLLATINTRVARRYRVIENVLAPETPGPARASRAYIGAE